MAQKRKTYQEHAEELAAAVDIAEKAILELGVEERQADEQMIAWGKEVKELALNPESAFKTVASLKYLINDFFIYWNEASGPAVEAFWKEIEASQLPFERKDLISDILRRGKIRNIPEYEAVTDGLVVLEQIGKITSEQAATLSQYLGEFEARKQKKSK